MAGNNGKRASDDALFQLLDNFEDMMRAMVRSGVTLHSFRKHASRLYVQAAVKESDGVYYKAADKIGLHRNAVTRIMDGQRVRAYDQTVQSKDSGQADDE